MVSVSWIGVSISITLPINLTGRGLVKDKKKELLEMFISVRVFSSTSFIISQNNVELIRMFNDSTYGQLWVYCVHLLKYINALLRVSQILGIKVKFVYKLSP